MDWAPASAIRWLFDSERGPTDRLIPRWLFLRALGLIYFSAFFSLLFQIRGLIGPKGILPADAYLHAVARSLGHTRFWFAPSDLPRVLSFVRERRPGFFWISIRRHAARS